IAYQTKSTSHQTKWPAASSRGRVPQSSKNRRANGKRSPGISVKGKERSGPMRDTRLDTALELAVIADERVTVGLLAECAGLSLSRFSHLFSRTTGMLPGEH